LVAFLCTPYAFSLLLRIGRPLDTSLLCPLPSQVDIFFSSERQCPSLASTTQDFIKKLTSSSTSIGAFFPFPLCRFFFPFQVASKTPKGLLTHAESVASFPSYLPFFPIGSANFQKTGSSFPKPAVFGREGISRPHPQSEVLGHYLQDVQSSPGSAGARFSFFFLRQSISRLPQQKVGPFRSRKIRETPPSQGKGQADFSPEDASAFPPSLPITPQFLFSIDRLQETPPPLPGTGLLRSVAIFKPLETL